MKQKNKFNKCIKRAIKAAYSEREEMQKQRDIWERAINEKDRQIDMLNSMLEVQPLDNLKAAKGDYESTVKEKPFDEVWGDFIKTLPEDTIRSIGLMNRGREWCEDFYNYKEIEPIDYMALGQADVEKYCIVPFIRYIKCIEILINSERRPIHFSICGYLLYYGGWVFNEGQKNTIQRIRPNS